jgi:hypothetical protein
VYHALSVWSVGKDANLTSLFLPYFLHYLSQFRRYIKIKGAIVFISV